MLKYKVAVIQGWKKNISIFFSWKNNKYNVNYMLAKVRDTMIYSLLICGLKSCVYILECILCVTVLWSIFVIYSKNKGCPSIFYMNPL